MWRWLGASPASGCLRVNFLYVPDRRHFQIFRGNDTETRILYGSLFLNRGSLLRNCCAGVM